MTLESAERLVEKILQQLEVQYEVTGDPASHHDHEHDGHHGEERTIVVDADALSRLPPELHAFVTTSAAPAAAPDADTPQPEK